MRGEIFDVAVDVRRGSPTFGQWVGQRLNAARPEALYIPVGFAHGFQVLSSEADVYYKVTSEYMPEAERGIAWNDPGLAVEWPLELAVLSERDSDWPNLDAADPGFAYPSNSE